jgi:hypothetical protein
MQFYKNQKMGSKIDRKMGQKSDKKVTKKVTKNRHKNGVQKSTKIDPKIDKNRPQKRQKTTKNDKNRGFSPKIEKVPKSVRIFWPIFLILPFLFQKNR